MRAINASIMRQINRKLILNQIRKQLISRAELAEETLLTRASVTQIIDELMAEGIVREANLVGRSKLGRRSTQLVLDAGSRCAFGVYWDTDVCQIGAIDLSGRLIIHVSEMVAGRPRDDVLFAVASTILRMKRELSIPDMGIGVTGHGLYTQEEILQAVTKLQTRTGSQVFTECIPNCEAMEEIFFGESGEDGTFALVHIDDDVNAAVSIRGQLYHGSHHRMLKMSTLPMEMGDMLDNKYFAQVLSVPAVLKDSPYETWQLMLADAQAPEAKAVMDRMRSPMANMAVGLVNLFDVDQILLTGDMAVGTEELIQQVNRMSMGRLAFIENEELVRTRQVNPIRAAAMPAYYHFFRYETRL